MDSLSQPSWVLGFGSVRFVRSSFPVDMDGAEGKRYIFRCIYIYIYIYIFHFLSSQTGV